MTEKASRGRTYERVINSIRDMLLRGELRPGDKLPPERDLAEQFGVSRVPIREAMKILEYMGVVDVSRGDGTYVRNLTVEDFVGKLNFALTATGGTIMDLLELRINLECFAAHQAANRRTDEDIGALEKALADMRTAMKNPAADDESLNRLRALSHEFHRQLIRAAHNSVLTGVYESLYELLDISRQFTIGTSGISYNSVLAHEMIFNRIIQRDAEGAGEGMREHLADVHNTLSAALAQAEQESRPAL